MRAELTEQEFANAKKANAIVKKTPASIKKAGMAAKKDREIPDALLSTNEVAGKALMAAEKAHETVSKIAVDAAKTQDRTAALFEGLADSIRDNRNNLLEHDLSFKINRDADMYMTSVDLIVTPKKK